MSSCLLTCLIRCVTVLACIYIATVVHAQTTPPTSPNPAPSKPNILFILVDDLGWRDLTCTGSDFYETPNIDRLASTGVKFTRAYSASPVCSPTRASILTGKYPARVGITQYIGGSSLGRLQNLPYLDHLPRTETTLATALRAGGYQTWHVGKWHLGDEPYYPEHHGFDVNIAGSKLGSPGRPNGFWSPYDLPNLKGGPPGEYLTDRLTDDALSLIRNRDKSRPFFLNYWSYAVHNPMQAPPDLVKKYEEKAQKMGLDNLKAIIEGEVMQMESPPGTRRGRVRRRVFQSNPVYAAMIENLDTNVGRLLSELEASGTLNDTIVVFTSDNGGLSTAEGSPTSNLPLSQGKGWMYEGGNRVALLVSWPRRIAPGKETATPVTSPDFYPTLLEAASLPPQPTQHVDGVSFLPLLTDAQQPDREAIYWHYPHYSNQGGTPAAAMIAGNWKFIKFFETGQVELYDLANDEAERKDLAKALPELAAKLAAKLESWQSSVAAKIPAPNPEWKPTP